MFGSNPLYKVVISVFLLVCQIILENPLTDIPQILNGKLGRARGMFLAWFYDSKLSGSTFFWKINTAGQHWAILAMLGSQASGLNRSSQMVYKPS